MIMIIFIIILSFFPPLLPVRFPGSQASLSRCLAARWPEVTQVEVVWAAQPGPCGPTGTHEGLSLLCCPMCSLAGHCGDGQGDRDPLRWLRCFWVGGRGAWRLKRYLSPVDGDELLPSSPALDCWILLAPGSSWCSGFILAQPVPGDWMFLKWLVCFC